MNLIRNDHGTKMQEMTMSWVRLWVHVVFCTKNKTPYLHTQELRQIMFGHIMQNAKNKNIWLDSVNGYTDHVHCLISLGREQTLSKIMQLIKGESSFWINKKGLIDQKFIWQDDYWAVGVSESHLKRVRLYIRNQEEHHQKISFKKEIADFERRYGWDKVRESKSKLGGIGLKPGPR